MVKNFFSFFPNSMAFYSVNLNLSFFQFVTCQADTKPELIIQLLKEHWMLSLPKIIISIHGEFITRDYSWLNVMNESLLITNGSSPSHQRSNNSSTIAIMDMNQIDNQESLRSTSNKVRPLLKTWLS